MHWLITQYFPRPTGHDRCTLPAISGQLDTRHKYILQIVDYRHVCYDMLTYIYQTLTLSLYKTPTAGITYCSLLLMLRRGASVPFYGEHSHQSRDHSMQCNLQTISTMLVKSPQFRLGDHTATNTCHSEDLTAANSPVSPSLRLCSSLYINSYEGLILVLRPVNERRRYFVTTFLFGWAQT